MDIIQHLYIFAFCVLLVTPLVVIYLSRKHFKGVASISLATIISATIMSGAVVVNWKVSDWYIDSKVALMDRDGDGFYSKEEESTWSPQERQYMEIHIGDGARNVFALIIFPMFSMLYSLVVSLAYWVVVGVWGRH